MNYLKHRTHFFVSTDTLAEILHSSNNLKVIDLRDKRNYSEGHIPNAINIQSSLFVKKTAEGFNALPNKENLENLLRSKGINCSDNLVFVDDVFNLNCSLAAWVLYYYGFESVMLLDGALGKWKKEDRPLDTFVPEYEEGDIKFSKLNSDILITRDELLVSLQTNDFVIVDNRSEYALTLDNLGGKIPGAIHYWWMNAFEEHPDYFVLKDLKTIESELYQKGITRESNVVLYCESAPESALIFFVLKQLSYNNVKLYLGGYEEWRLYCSFI